MYILSMNMYWPLWLTQWCLTGSCWWGMGLGVSEALGLTMVLWRVEFGRWFFR